LYSSAPKEKIVHPEAQRGKAASFQRSAFSGQLLDESGQHPFDFNGVRDELFVKRCRKELKVFGEQRMVLQFARGTACDGAETSELCVAAPPATPARFAPIEELARRIWLVRP
jgi:hypothetical protein